MFQITERILLTLWIGGMWSVGYIVAPTLFSMLEDRALAGAVAGQLFTIMSFVGLVAAAVLLSAQLYYAESDWHRNWRVWVLLLMLLLIVIGEFYLQPLMAELKSGGLSQGSDNARQFGQLHGVASALFVINSLLGLGLVVFGLRPSTAPAI
ncbi:MAG: DUF4149 domain-containing protein [Gammaproteobacteria bacterium]|nr:DUF4149 domain-containing protein [Gammaproteobacteria bacterium]